jgi:hypothetical protein
MLPHDERAEHEVRRNGEVRHGVDAQRHTQPGSLPHLAQTVACFGEEALANP